MSTRTADLAYLDNTSDDPTQRAPLVLGGRSFGDVTDAVCGIVENPRTPPMWYVFFAASLGLLGVLGAMIAYLIFTGVGVWGLQNPVGWGWAIVNFVFWVGIGHAGTLISAILFLLRQKWRTSINRFAEAMTIFAVACAGIFPAIHVGRVWVVYWLFPYPNQMAMWPNFRSPLLWDVFAVSTYATVSTLFWYMGMIPISPPSATGPSTPSGRSPTASRPWVGAPPTATGIASRPRTCCWPAWPRRWCSRCTRW
jgi:hypothetical protein